MNFDSVGTEELPMKFKSSIKKALISEVEGVQGSYGARFEEDGPPTSTITAKRRGTWLWVTSQADYEGNTWDYTTDRAGGDPYSAHVVHDWIGKRETAPTTVSDLDELDSWALLHTRYEQEYTDVGAWGVHSDRYVRDVSSDGIVKVNVVSNRRFQDVSPVSETTIEEVDMTVFNDISFDALAVFIDGPNPFNREIAAKLLGQLGDPRAINPYLIKATNDDSNYVQERAVKALGSIGGKKAIEKLSSILLERPYPHKSVIHALSEIGELVLDSIAPALISENQRISTAAVQIIKNIGGTQANSMLIEALEGTRKRRAVDTLESIIRSLGELGVSKAVAGIITCLEDDESAVQLAAIRALMALEDPRAIDPLVQALVTTVPWNRDAVVEALTHLGWRPSNPDEKSRLFVAKEEWDKLIAMGESAVDTILLALTDKDDYQRGKILDPLSKAGVTFGDPRIADAILAIYKDKEQTNYRKREAIEALSCIPVPKVAAFLLREYTKVKDNYLQRGLIDSIKNLVMADIDFASKLVSHLKKKKLDELPKEIIEAYLHLFTVIPLTQKQLETIKPWIASIETRKLKKEARKVVSELRSLELIIPAFSDGKFTTRKNAMETMNEIMIPSAVYPLIEALGDDHCYIREKAAKAIGNLGEGALTKTIAALENEDHQIRMGAAEALGRLRFAKSTNPLLKALKDENHIVRQNAAWAVGRLHLGYDRYKKHRGNIIKSLTKLMKTDPYPPVRFNAVYSLGQIPDKRVVAPLLEAMNNPAKEFRLNATDGFNVLAHELARDSKEWNQIVDRLVMSLTDDVDRVRHNVVDGLRLFMGKKALNALESIEEIEDPTMKELVEKAIKQIKTLGDKRRSSWGHSERVHYELRDPDTIEELIPFFMDESDEVQRSTQIAISKFGEIAYDRMMELLQDNEQHYLIRMGAAATFGDIGDKKATDILIETLNDEHEDVRCNAAWALAELKDKRSVKALLKATKDSNWQVRANAGAALGKIKGRGTLDAILSLLEDDHPQVREICTSYLGQFKSPRVMPALKLKLKDEDKKVRKMAQSWITHLEKD